MQRPVQRKIYRVDHHFSRYEPKSINWLNQQAEIVRNQMIEKYNYEPDDTNIKLDTYSSCLFCAIELPNIKFEEEMEAYNKYLAEKEALARTKEAAEKAKDLEKAEAFAKTINQILSSNKTEEEKQEDLKKFFARKIRKNAMVNNGNY